MEGREIVKKNGINICSRLNTATASRAMLLNSPLHILLWTYTRGPYTRRKFDEGGNWRRLRWKLCSKEPCATHIFFSEARGRGSLLKSSLDILLWIDMCDAYTCQKLNEGDPCWSLHWTLYTWQLKPSL